VVVVPERVRTEVQQWVDQRAAMLDKNSWLQWLRRHGQFVRSGLGRTDVLGGGIDEEATQFITKDSPKERITNNATRHWLATYSSPWSTSYLTAFLEKHDTTITEIFNISWPRLNAYLGILCQRLLEKFERLERRLGRTRQPWIAAIYSIRLQLLLNLSYNLIRK